MNERKKVIAPKPMTSETTISSKVKGPSSQANLSINFEKFNLRPICLKGQFNNHFKDQQHFSNVMSNLLGTILPMITSHPYTEICEGTNDGRILHFHTIDKPHQKMVRDVLTEYGFSSTIIDQMLEGNDLFGFSASLGHVYPARIVCHKIDDLLFLLFLDTNHHIYMNEKYVRDSLFYEDCPSYVNDNCAYMPGDCFAVSFLDEAKLKESFGYTENLPT